MKYHEFGQENKKTLLILCGFGVCWTPAALPLIEAAKKEYHVIVTAYDGFNPDEPDTVFTSVEDEGEKAAGYLLAHFNGKIDVIYSSSLGGLIMTEVLTNEEISVHTAIADGFPTKELPHFRSKFARQLYAHLFSSIAYSMLYKHRKLAAKLYGRTEKEAAALIYEGAAKQSYFNCDYHLIPYHIKYDTFAKTDFHIWHCDGIFEKTIIKNNKEIIKLREKGYPFTHKNFQGVGHGGLARQPERLMKEINRVYQQE